MASAGKAMFEIVPTITEESAVMCVVMLNMFLGTNEDYRLERFADESGLAWHLVKTSDLRTEML